MINSNQLIIWCGDSWTKGWGLSTVQAKQFRFSSLVNNKLNVDGLNLSIAGSSIGHLVYKLEQIQRLQKSFPNKEFFVLFGLTVPYRLCIRPNFGKKITVGVNDFDITSYHIWAKDVFSNSQIIDETCLRLCFISDQCRKLKIKFKFYNILCNFNDFEKSKFVKYLNTDDWLIDKNWTTYSELFDIDNFNFDKMGILEKTTVGKKIKEKYFIINDTHPNIDGHKKIADKLASAINLNNILGVEL
jgi:lysophospholipase L1-like esterase